jgi:hypothetical protein
MAENEVKSTESPKKKRSYHRKPTPPPPPPPPSAAVSALEADVLELVKQRLVANQAIINATAAANEANSRLQAAQQHLRNLEQEVNYRMALIGQMKGGGADKTFSVITNTSPNNIYLGNMNEPQGYESGMGVSIPPGVGSIAPLNQPRIVPSGPRIRSESAEGVRNDEIGVRAAI